MRDIYNQPSDKFHIVMLAAALAVVVGLFACGTQIGYLEATAPAVENGPPSLALWGSLGVAVGFCASLAVLALRVVVWPQVVRLCLSVVAAGAMLMVLHVGFNPTVPLYGPTSLVLVLFAVGGGCVWSTLMPDAEWHVCLKEVVGVQCLFALFYLLGFALGAVVVEVTPMVVWLLTQAFGVISAPSLLTVGLALVVLAVAGLVIFAAVRMLSAIGRRFNSA